MSAALEISTDDIVELTIDDLNTIDSIGYTAEPNELIPQEDFNLQDYLTKENII